MTRSTILLFKMVRWRLAIGMAISFLFFILLAFFQPPLDKEYITLIPIIGFIIALLMHGLLSNTMFPVSNRQVAWIPLTAWGLTCLAGMTGLILGQLFMVALSIIAIGDMLDYWLHSFTVVPPIFFLLLLCLRVSRMNPGVIGFVGFVPLLAMPSNKSGFIPSWLVEYFFWGWPVWAVGCVFLVWEAPWQVDVLRRFAIVENNQGWIILKIPQLNGPARKSLSTLLADNITTILFTITSIAIFAHVLLGFANKAQRDVIFPYHIFFLFLLIIPISAIRNEWRQIRGSGLSVLRTAGVLLIESTGVGYVFRHKLGVVRGEKVRCRYCNNWRIVWQEVCPHCGDDQKIDDASSDTNEEKRRNIAAIIWSRYDPEAIVYRAIVPIYIIGLIIVLNWSHWFGR